MLEYLIFEQISIKPRYGRELVEYAHHMISVDIKIPTVYAILNRSKEFKLLEVSQLEEKPTQTRGTRRMYYSLSKNGENYLKELRNHISHSFELINSGDEIREVEN